MSKYAIQVENLGKEYIIGGAEQRHDSFREMLTSTLTSPLQKLRKLGGVASDSERFWSLKDISFNVKQGEVLGIIGRNGAGKSTLLKVLSRITSPTTGRIVTRGRLASLLEVGTGFHPELTGRENIYLNGAILGMSRNEIDRKFDEIVQFANIEQFLDTPVKRYSSGMYVRLAFAVAASLDSEILLIDEVLAVGDSAFQKKCLGKMGEVADLGRTVLFVSHNMSLVQNLCQRALVLHHGNIVIDATIQEAVDEYLASLGAPDEISNSWNGKRRGNGWIRATSIQILMNMKPTSVLQTGSDVSFVMFFKRFNPIEEAGFRLDILTEIGGAVLSLGTDYFGYSVRISSNCFKVTCRMRKLPLMPGRYFLKLVCGSRGELSDEVLQAEVFDVVEGDYFGGGKLPIKGSTHVLAPHEWSYGEL